MLIYLAVVTIMRSSVFAFQVAGWISGSDIRRAWLFLASCQAVVFLERGVAWCLALVALQDSIWQVQSGASAEVAGEEWSLMGEPASTFLICSCAESYVFPPQRKLPF